MVERPFPKIPVVLGGAAGVPDADLGLRLQAGLIVPTIYNM